MFKTMISKIQKFYKLLIPTISILFFACMEEESDPPTIGIAVGSIFQDDTVSVGDTILLDVLVKKGDHDISCMYIKYGNNQVYKKASTGDKWFNEQYYFIAKHTGRNNINIQAFDIDKNYSTYDIDFYVTE